MWCVMLMMPLIMPRRGGAEHVACEGYGKGRGYEECEAVEQGEYYYRRRALGEDYQAEAGYAGEEA